jgi:hypothetical protein
MIWTKFITWLAEPNPQKVFKDNIESLNTTIVTPGFDIYSKIIQWRIHNISERILVKPKTEDYLLGYIEGLRAILKDKTKIEKLYQQFKKK